MENTRRLIISRLTAALLLVSVLPLSVRAAERVSRSLPPSLQAIIKAACFDCHGDAALEGDLNLQTLSFDLSDRAIRDRWIRIFDRVERREMPPDSNDLSDELRSQLTRDLGEKLHAADLADVEQFGRGPMRRLNRDEYQQNLRDLLKLPNLDIRDRLPEDRVSHLFNKTSEALDISRVQLTAYLDAAESALLAAMASGVEPPVATKYRAVGRNLFSATSTFGNRQAMFFSRDSRAISNEELGKSPDDPAIELALFRSAHWPYYGYPQGFVAKLPGEYRVRFSARAVLQTDGFQLTPATRPLPMTFRARKPSGPDVSGDVRATGGLIDIQPEPAVYETTISLKPTETFEYSLLGLPVPLARNVNGGPPTYRYPPFPAGGQPGVAFQWLEVEGPLAADHWPPEPHRILFGDLPLRPATQDSRLPIDVASRNPRADATRLLRTFVSRASREPVSDETARKFDALVQAQLDQNVPFVAALLTGYKAFLCSSHVLYLREPFGGESDFAVASRLSHFLTNSRPDDQLTELARAGRLRETATLQSETERLIASDGFARFVTSFTDYWLNLRHIQRDEPDVRLYPEYRFDSYLIESMERETRAFFTALIRENLPATALVDGDFVFANDRLAEHYGLPPINGSTLKKVPLAADSPYGGLLTQGAILKVTANGTSTSPVVRGAWVMERLIGEPPPPPPKAVPAVEPDIRGAETIRDLLALHTKEESCAACHALFDPVGLALENFDIFGAWRTRYRSLAGEERVTGIDRAGHDFAYATASPVDSSGQLRDGRKFQDINDLKALLADNPRQLARNLLHQFTVYATGTPVRFSDRAEIERLLNKCSSNGYRIRDLLQAFVQSEIFLGLQDGEGNQ
jgi:mono/diheme cytochrome c family protein